MKDIQAIGVYCGSHEGTGKVYQKAALELGRQLALHSLTMIYGGGDDGLMGFVSQAARAHGGRVIGFMPHPLKKWSDLPRTMTQGEEMDRMHRRKRLMFEHSDAFIILPGGFGTLEEVFELITWSQLNFHHKPIIFININHYWTPLEELTSHIFSQNFAHPAEKKLLKFVNSIVEAFHVLFKTSTKISYGA